MIVFSLMILTRDGNWVGSVQVALGSIRLSITRNRPVYGWVKMQLTHTRPAGHSFKLCYISMHVSIYYISIYTHTHIKICKHVYKYVYQYISVWITVYHIFLDRCVLVCIKLVYKCVKVNERKISYKKELYINI